MTTKSANPSPLLLANLWSRLFFSWLSPLLKQSRKRSALDQDDLYELPSDLNILPITKELEANWLDELKHPTRSPSLLRATIRTVRRKVLLISLLMVPQALITIGQPLMIVFLMDFFDLCTSMKVSTAWALVAVSIAVIWIPCVFYHHHAGQIRCFGMQMRAAYSDLIYRKTLRLSNESMKVIGTGGINNLLSSDASKIETGLVYLDYLWRAPVEFALVIGFFSYFAKYISLIAFGYTILILASQLLISRILVNLRSKIFQVTDQRVKLMSEIIKSMRIVKVYCWESAFLEQVLSIRQREFIRYAYCVAVNCVTQTLIYTYTPVTFFLMYTTMWAMGTPLDTQFFALCACLIGYLQYAVMDFLLQAIRYLIEYLAAEKRIRAFLLLPECERDERLLSQPILAQVKADKQLSNMLRNDPNRSLKIICNLKSARWDERSSFALTNINFEAFPGDLICVIGPVGSGKTSLLHALSGEIALFTGKVRMYGSCCYLPQEPWIFSSSIKDNILFGQEYNQVLFKRVIRAAALDTDLKQLQHGVQTMVGDQGVMLSGGQKARVNLARALYRNADIYLLDDPLSAVDAKVSKHLFEKAIKGYLRKKICVLVTHQTQFLKDATKIIELDQGKVVRVGTHVELLAASSSYCRQLNVIVDEDSETNEPPPESVDNSSLLKLERDDHEPSQAVASLTNNVEVKQTGAVRWQVYVEFVRAGIGLLLGLAVFSLTYCMREGVFVYHNWWLAKWTDDENYRYQVSTDCTNITNAQAIAIKLMNEVEWKDHRDQRFFTYAILVCVLFAVTLCRGIATQFICLNASRVLHNRMFQCIIHCPIAVFDVNPVGRMLNRFTKDISISDGVLPDLIHEFMHYAFYVLGTMALVGWINPWSLIAAALALAAMVYVRSRFARCLRDLRRIEGTTRSPVYSHLTSTMHGIQVIRSYRAEEMCTSQFRAHLDVNNRANYLVIALSRWAGMRFDLIACGFFILIIVPAMIVRVVESKISAADIGLTFSYGLNLVGLMQWAIRLSVDCETQMTAVERVLDYCSFEQEPPAEVPPDRRPPNDWPTKGEIVFDDVSLSHSGEAGSPLALCHISMRIDPSEKVGVVGRTGAGKTSLVESLFRMRTSINGQIRIDNIDISTVGLNDVRRRISIIPQEPILFSGTMRKNLDRMDEYTDEQIWHALEEVKLKRLVAESMPRGLESEVSENGSNLSVGQKQLVCLARAILKKSKILVMDEATANVDHETDEIIQRTIREKFKQCTVLTVAHRLRTVIDSHRIAVLDHGKLLEFDAPYVLLNDPESRLTSLANQLGETEFRELRRMAKAAVEPPVHFECVVTRF